MKQISAEQLARQNPAKSCCDCGKEAASSSGTWTIQGGNCRCPSCSRNEGLY